MTTPLQPNQTTNRRLAVRKTLIIFLPIFAFLLAVTIYVFNLELKADRWTIKENGNHSIEISKNIVIDTLEPILSDLQVLHRFIEDSNLFQNPESPDPKIIENITRLFLFYSASHKIYDQIRLFDKTGMELVRVNFQDGKPVLVPKSDLQSKGKRYYFRDTYNLEKGQKFISPFDLNIEHGEIERPFKPMIRIGMPVFDKNGKKQGVVLLNYLGSYLINRLKTNHNKLIRNMLVNLDGFWLIGTSPEQEWGFMFNDRQQETFGNYYPKAWKIIQSLESGQFENEEGLFTFTTNYLLKPQLLSSTGSREARSPSQKQLSAREYYWKIISYTPPDLLNRKRDLMLKWGLLLLSIVSLIILTGSWKVALAGQIRRQAEDSLLKAKSELELQVKSRTVELKESEEKYRSIMESMEDAVYICSHDFKIEYANPAMEKLIGDSNVGQTCYQSLYKFDHQCSWCIHDKIQNGNFESFELTNPRNDRTYLVSNSPIRHNDGTISKLTVFRDITYLKQTETELKKSSTNLSKRLREHNCLYNISNLTHRSHLTIDELLQNAVDLLPAAWQHPEICSARISYEGKEFCTSNFQSVVWKQSSPIKVFEKIVGEIEVFYSEYRPEQDEGPFLKEERNLIKLVSVHLGDVLQHLKSETALKESEFKFASHIQNTPVAVIEFNNDLTITSWNTSAERIFGFWADEAIGQHLLDLTVPEYEREHIYKMVKTNISMASENINENITKDGRIITCNWFNTPMKNLAGEIIGMSSICEDITDKRKILETLQKSEERYRELVEGTNDLITMVNNQGKITYVNHSATRVFGLEPKDCIGKSAFSFVDPRDSESTQQWFESCIKSNLQNATFENRQVSRNGDAFDMIWTANFHYDDKGAIDYITSIGRDITERKRQERLLEVRLRLSEFSITHSVDQLLQKFLDEAELLTNSSIGFYHFLEPDQVTLTLQMWSTNTLNHMCKAEGKGSHYPINEAGVWVDAVREKAPVIHNDYESLPHKKGLPEGHAPVVRQLVVPVTKNDKIVAILGVGNKKSDYFDLDAKTLSELADIAWDMVQRKRAEETNKKLETQLQQSQKMEAIGTLAGGIAHDFNNILHAIIGYGQLAKSKLTEDHPVKRNLGEMLKASFRATDLVRQILNFSRQTKQEIGPVAVLPIIKEVIKLLRASTPTTIEIQQHIKSKSGWTIANPTQIHQIMMNICTNAIQAMRDKVGTLTIGLEDIEIAEKEAALHLDLTAGEYLRLSVSDTGQGIPQDQLALIFDPFFTTKDVGEGTGLGLSVVHGIVKNLSGAIKVYSEVGIGTTFQIFFPRLEQAKNEQFDVADSAVPTGSESVLFIDDEEPLVDIGKQILEPLGYRVTGITSSTEALALFQSHPDNFDLIITDQTMPKMTGLDMSQKMLQIRQDIPIIICSGFSEQLMTTEPEKVGIKQFLFKPLVASQLARTVREVLG